MPRKRSRLCSSAILSLQEYLKAFNFRFIQTTKYQHTKNLHFSTQLFAVTSAAANSRVVARQMADCFIVFYNLHGKFVDCIIRLLFCMKFFAYCGFPNIFIQVVYLLIKPLSTRLIKPNFCFTLSSMHHHSLET